MTSRIVPPLYPPPGASPIADAIRVRRGARGLTPLDGALLHVPAVADGWNSLLGAVRTKGELPGDVRELMILRVAARNQAKFEWIHHEPVGREAGLTTGHLFIIRDYEDHPIPSPSFLGRGVLSSLQAVALAFADASTKTVQVEPEITQSFANELRVWVDQQAKGGERTAEEQVQSLLVEAAAVVATYNMVSRFLVSLDVAGMSSDTVPWPFQREEHTIPISSSGLSLHAVTITTYPDSPWLVFSHSLLTSIAMWSPLLPFILNSQHKFNLLFVDQRGHGESTIPAPASSSNINMEQLADDIAFVISSIGINKVHAVIGVSIGGATALSFSVRHSEMTDRVIACDTSPISPPGNKVAWDERLALAKGSVGGMHELALITAKRWFPPGSLYRPIAGDAKYDEEGSRAQFIIDMITSTSMEGFEAGAGALQEYDLISKGLLGSKVPTLLVAGSEDGGGVIATGLQTLAERWNHEKEGKGDAGQRIEFLKIVGCGHLPMIDGPGKFWEAVEGFLTS